MKTALIIALLFAPVLLLAIAITLNRPPLFEAPGFKARLKTYLTQNVAETSPDSPYPELRLAPFQVPADTLYQALEPAVRRLGWMVAEQDNGQRAMHLVVTTTLWRFKDDVQVRVVARGARSSIIHVRSASRVGKGDLAANTRHILDLLAVLKAAGLARPEGSGNVTPNVP